MADTSTWRIEPLAEGVVSRVVASALVLHGGPGARDYTASLADELDRVLDCEHYQQGRHLQVAGYLGEAAARLRAPAWIVGHSWGGRLALHLAAARPELVRRLILI